MADGHNFKGEELVNVDMSDATIRDSNLARITLRNVNLSRAKITEAYLVGAHIEGDLTGVTVNGLDLASMYENELLRLYPERRRLAARTPEDFRDALALITENRSRTFQAAAAIDKKSLYQQTSEGEWGVVENLRHLIFAESAWALRTAFNEPKPFHPLGLPPDHAVDEAVAVGLNIHLEASYDDVVDAMLEQFARVKARFELLTPEELGERCLGRGKGYPGDYDGTVAGALHTYLSHEWDHHRILERVMAELA
jgi:hypothetical protein